MRRVRQCLPEWACRAPQPLERCGDISSIRKTRLVCLIGQNFLGWPFAGASDGNVASKLIMNEQAFQILEFDKLRELLRGGAQTPMGREQLAALAPSGD